MLPRNSSTSRCWRGVSSSRRTCSCRWSARLGRSTGTGSTYSRTSLAVRGIPDSDWSSSRIRSQSGSSSASRSSFSVFASSETETSACSSGSTSSRNGFPSSSSLRCCCRSSSGMYSRSIAWYRRGLMRRSWRRTPCCCRPCFIARSRGGGQARPQAGGQGGAEVALRHPVVEHEVADGAGDLHLPLEHDVRPVHDVERLLHVVVGDQHADAA